MSDPLIDITIRKYYPPRLVRIDGDDGPTDIPVQVRRVDNKELATVNRLWVEFKSPPSLRAIYRLPDTDEMATKDTAVRLGGIETSVTVFVVDDDEIKRRRLAAMTPEQRAVWDTQDRADNDRQLGILAELVTIALRVSPSMPNGQPVRIMIEDTDGGAQRQARTGADLVAMFGGNLETLGRMARLVIDETTLSAEKKTRWRPPSDLNGGSPPPQPVTGETPAAIAPSAGPPVSVDPASVAPQAPAP